MPSDNTNNTNTSSAPTDMARNQRRGSVTSAVSNLFRNNSVGQAPGSAFSGPLSSGAMSDQRRRLSITTLGLSGTSPTTAASASFLRRASLSTNSDSIDENAVEDDDIRDRGAPTPGTPFARRMSIGATQAMRGVRAGTSPGSNDQGFNWSDQLRSRAESTVTGSRPSISFASGLSGSPPRLNNVAPPQPPAAHHERAKSVSDMPAPPAQAPRARVPQKPDPFQERILKGDFYMD